MGLTFLRQATQPATAVVGIMGQKGSGKDTFASHLVPFNFQRLAFADKLKDSLLWLDPFVTNGDTSIRLSLAVKHYGWDSAKRAYPEIRRLLQMLGAEVARGIDPDIWVKGLAGEVEKARKAGYHVAITDVRFLNEAAYIKSIGGVLVRIDRPGLVDDDKHVSEQEWRTVQPDVTITNSVPLDQVAGIAAQLASDLGIKRTA